ncbi:MAG: dCMP deaminase family protein [Thiomicrorhabdus sp.]|jgi:dCMP deaminase|nr:dCMP deaminase family protein [Thiomicrorhabdus sp.]
MTQTKSDQYFMGVAHLTASQSYCNRKQVGAVLTRNGHILATGRNGTLPEHDNCCEELVDGVMVTNELTLHAEQNVLTFCLREGVSTKHSTMYVTLSPCKTCAKLMASAGIEVVVYDEQYRDTGGVDFLNKVGIPTTKF